MPTYVYECDRGHTFEVQQRITEEPLKVCSRKGCKGLAKRVITACNFTLKGSGFYRNDVKRPAEIQSEVKQINQDVAKGDWSKLGYTD